MRSTNWMKAGFVLALLVSAFAGRIFAQQWEVGAVGGGAFYFNNSVSGPRGDGEAGFKPGFAAGGWVGHDTAGHFGGAFRYLLQMNDLKAAAGGKETTFAAQSHTLTYDFHIYSNTREDRVRPYVVAGAGFKAYRGAGVEHAIQPLSNIAILSKTHEWTPVVNFGAGVKLALSNRLAVRAEVRDYLTPFPKNVIVPGPGAKISGWVHDLTPLIGLSYILY